MLQGIDISQWQADVDYSALAQSVDFAMVRASYSLTIVDHLGWNHRSELRSRLVNLGHYHYAEPAHSVAAIQARVFLDSVGWIFAGEPMALDLEVDHPRLVEWSRNFAQIILNVLGRPPLIYTNIDFLRRYDFRPLYEMGCPLWVASWQDPTAAIPSTAPWEAPRMHQFTSQGSIPGIAGDVDLDTFFGSVDDFHNMGAIAHGG